MWNTSRDGDISNIKELAVGFSKCHGKSRKMPLDLGNQLISGENPPCSAEKAKVWRNLFGFACATIQSTTQWPVLIRTAELNVSAVLQGSVCLDLYSHSKICTGILITETSRRVHAEKPRRKQQSHFTPSSTAHRDALLLPEHRPSGCPAALW